MDAYVFLQKFFRCDRSMMCSIISNLYCKVRAGQAQNSLTYVKK